MSGWIKLHRQLLGHWIWSSPIDAYRWIDLLFLATHCEGKVLHGGQTVNTLPGEIYTSEVKLAARWSTSRKSVSRFLRLLQSDGMITLEKTKIGTTVKVLNYQAYQAVSDPGEDNMGSNKGSNVGSNKGSSIYNEKNKRTKDLYGQQGHFDLFWAAYPRKVKKQDAHKAWAKLKGDDALFREIMAGLERAKTSADWAKEGGQFIPHPTTWLNGRRWEDEDGQSSELEGVET